MKYNLASGSQKMEGYISVDLSPDCKPDLVKDLKKFPWDWMEEANEIRIDNYLEHCSPTDLIKTLNECYKKIKLGGKLWIRVPVIPLRYDFENIEKDLKDLLIHLDGVHTDITHRNIFTEDSFDYFDIDHPRHKSFGVDYGVKGWKRVRNELFPPKFLIVILIR